MEEKKPKRPKTKSQKVALVSLITSAVILPTGFIPDQFPGMGITLGVIFAASLLVLYFSLFGLIADMAARKGRSWQAFFWLSLLVTPLVMLIIAASISPQAGSAAYVAPTQSGTPDSAEQLKKLAELRDEGILTKAEFEAKKKELLDRI